jgi:hypothetical protein
VRVVLGADDDKEGILLPAERLSAAIADRAGDSARSDVVVVDAMAHALAEEPGLEPAPQTAAAATVDRHAVEWFARHLGARGPASRPEATGRHDALREIRRAGPLWWANSTVGRCQACGFSWSEQVAWGVPWSGIAARRDYVESMVVADYDLDRAKRAVSAVDDPRFVAAKVDANDEAGVVALLREHRCDRAAERHRPALRHAAVPRGAGRGAHYLDMAMSLSRPHPGGALRPDRRDARRRAVRDGGRVGGERAPRPGRHRHRAGPLDVFARYAADHLFSEIVEIGVRDGANLTVEGYDFAPSFSIWTTIEECLNPPLIWEKERGFYTTPPFSEPEVFDFPEGIGPVECVNVEHEEVALIPRWVDAKRVTFKYGLGSEFIEVLSVLHKLGLDRTDPVRVGGVEVSPA